jgi:CheY-like chemotaxis protein
MADARNDAKPNGAHRSGVRLGSCTTAPVLLVEDDASLRDAMLIELQSVGLRVMTAANGEEALAVARDGPRPSVIVLDLNMPVMDGWQFRAKQILDPRLADIPVIVLTARGDADRQARSLGVAAALSKPVDLDRLHEALAAHC